MSTIQASTAISSPVTSAPAAKLSAGTGNVDVFSKASPSDSSLTAMQQLAKKNAAPTTNTAEPPAAPLTPEQQQAIKTLQSVDLLNHPLQLGDKGDSIRRLKDGLAILEPSLKGSDSFSSDSYHQSTVDAVKKYQTQKNLPANGQVNEMTMGIAFHDLFWNHDTTLNLIDPAVYRDLPALKVSVNTGLAQNGGQRVSLLAPDGSVVKQFPTSTGSATYPTPKGKFKIQSITERPSWNPPASPWAAGAHKTPPGPNNPVGNVKMNVVSDVYLHGVPPKEYGSIGKVAESHGCMRMFQSDAWQLHEIIKNGTPVEIH
jgi:lipoprotein-anchoring transpeptidase ErfK/SrfK